MVQGRPLFQTEWTYVKHILQGNHTSSRMDPAKHIDAIKKEAVSKIGLKKAFHCLLIVPEIGDIFPLAHSTALISDLMADSLNLNLVFQNTN